MHIDSLTADVPDGKEHGKVLRKREGRRNEARGEVGIPSKQFLSVIWIHARFALILLVQVLDFGQPVTDVSGRRGRRRLKTWHGIDMIPNIGTKNLSF